MKKKEMVKKFDELASISYGTRPASLKGTPDGIGEPAVRLALLAMSAAFAVAASIADEVPEIAELADKDPTDIVGTSLMLAIEQAVGELR